MGMVANYVAISSDDWDAVKGSSESATNFLFGRQEEQPSERSWDLDKAWHAISVLYSGGDLASDEFDPEDCVLGGVETEIDMGLGPARVFDEALTARIADRLSALSIDELFSRYDATTFEAIGVYPNIWDETDEEILEYVGEFYEHLRKGFKAAKSNRHVVVTWIS